MAQSNRNPRSMVNKFDSTCGDCGRVVDKGETILYHGRGYIQCDQCAPVNSIPNDKPLTSAQAWENALAWDDNAPAKGASIGAINNPPGNVAVLERAIAEAPIVDTVAAPELVELTKAMQSSDSIEPVQTAPDPLDDISATDRAEALTTELLLILVNAIDVAGVSGRHGLQSFCKANAERSIDMSTRQHIWRGIGQAIQRA